MKISPTIDTWCECKGAEHDVLVEYDAWPAEYDTNTAAGMEVTAVWFENQGCILDQMTEKEVASLEERVIEYLNGVAEYDKGEFEYERRKDMALDIRHEEMAMNNRQRGAKL